MSGQYRVQDFKDALVIESFQKRPWVKAALSGVVAVVISALFLDPFFSRRQMVIPSTLFGLLGALASLRAAKAHLRVTSNEFQMYGTYGPDHRIRRTVNTADVLGFSYLPYQAIGDDASYPGGLYALVGSQSVCLLPYIDEDDVSDLVDINRARYAHMRWLTVYTEN